MDIVLMAYEIPSVADAMVSESPLPDFSPAAEDSAKSVRIPALDELHRMFERNVMSRGEQEMNMLRHNDKGVQLEAPSAAVAIDCLQEQANVVLDHEQPSTLMRRKRHKICSGWGDKSSGLQGQTSAGEPAIFA